MYFLTSFVQKTLRFLHVHKKKTLCTVSQLHFLNSIYLQISLFEISTTDLLALSLKSKMYSRKDIPSKYIKFAPNQKKNWEIL